MNLWMIMLLLIRIVNISLKGVSAVKLTWKHLLAGFILSCLSLLIPGKPGTNDYLQLFGYPVQFVEHHTYSAQPIRSIDLFSIERFRHLNVKLIPLFINSSIYSVIIYFVYYFYKMLTGAFRKKTA